MSSNLSEMVRAAHRLITESLRIETGESLAVIADSAQDPRLVESFVVAARGIGIDVSTAIYATRSRDQEEPSRPVAAAMAAADAYILIPTRSIVYTDAQRAAKEAGARLLVCSGMKASVLTDIVPHIDYSRMESLGQSLMEILDRTETVRITSVDGADLSVPVAGRPHFVHDGVSSLPGEEDDIPGGGAFVIPDEGAAQGRWVFNASLIPPCGKIASPITVDFKDGRIVDISGGSDADLFRDWLHSFDDDRMLHLVELGFGLNEACFLTGTVPGVDESINGMVHIGVGSNVGFGGTLEAPSHTDGMLGGADVWFDDKKVIERGVYLV